MTSSRCNRLSQALAHRPYDGAMEIPDDLALHLDRCAECRQHFDLARVELDPGVFERLSDERRRAVVGALARARSAAGRRRLSVAAAAVIAVGVAVAYHFVGRDGEAVATALVEDHIRYLRHPDRRSSDDVAAVAADLEAHVDFPVRLPQPPGSRLTGGRRCFLLGRRVALAFYDTQAGPASYFVFDAEGLSVPGRACPGEADLACRLVRGYRVVSWEEAGLLHALVGPHSEALQAVAAATRKTPSGPSPDQPPKGDER